MIGGQQLDLEGGARLGALHALKTGALFSAPRSCAACGRRGCRRPSIRRGARSPPSSGCSSRSSTTSWTATATSLEVGADGARRLADEAAERAQARLEEIDGETGVLREIVADLAVRTARDETGVTKKRLDVLLVERGLAESRAQAQALVMAGRVPGHTKPGEQVERRRAARGRRRRRRTSRAPGTSSRTRSMPSALDVAGLDALDVGASTGGFTDVLLQRGAARVIALDVGHGQLHARLRDDPRVTVLERSNARSLTELPFAPQLVTCDVSFISVRLALPPALALAAPGWQALVLVKPQFEAGRAEVPKGVVRDPAVQRRVVREVAEALAAGGARDARGRRLGLAGPEGKP